MYAERLTLQTDAQGNLTGLPDLPPETRVEVILLLPEATVSAKPCRRPPPALKNKIKVCGDIINPVVAEEEWDMLR